MTAPATARPPRLRDGRHLRAVRQAPGRARGADPPPAAGRVHGLREESGRDLSRAPPERCGAAAARAVAVDAQRGELVSSCAPVLGMACVVAPLGKSPATPCDTGPWRRQRRTSEDRVTSADVLESSCMCFESTTAAPYIQVQRWRNGGSLQTGRRAKPSTCTRNDEVYEP
jgi:hypothetical protein